MSCILDCAPEVETPYIDIPLFPPQDFLAMQNFGTLELETGVLGYGHQIM